VLRIYKTRRTVGKCLLFVSPPLNLLRQTFITPESGFFVRNHGSIPEVDLVNYRLSVTGNVQQFLNLSLDELRAAFGKQTITATLHCAGNRRFGVDESGTDSR
jgi:sulfite oxidase